MATHSKTERGHEEPFVRQFSVFLPNRVGQLRELVELFIQRGVHLIALDVVGLTDWAVVRMILSDPDHGRELLKLAGLSYTESQMLAVELPSPDALAGVAAALLAAELNLQAAYPMMMTAREGPVVAVQVEDYTLAVQVLLERGFRLLDEPDLWPRNPDV